MKFLILSILIGYIASQVSANVMEGLDNEEHLITNSNLDNHEYPVCIEFESSVF